MPPSPHRMAISPRLLVAHRKNLAFLGQNPLVKPPPALKIAQHAETQRLPLRNFVAHLSHSIFYDGYIASRRGPGTSDQHCRTPQGERCAEYLLYFQYFAGKPSAINMLPELPAYLFDCRDFTSKIPVIRSLQPLFPCKSHILKIRAEKPRGEGGIPHGSEHRTQPATQ